MGKNVLTIDFSTVQSGGGQSLIPPGDYVFKITKVEQRKSKKENGGAYLNWTLKGVNGDAKGATIYHVTSLQPQALWNLYDFLVAVGVEVPKKKVRIDFNKIVGKYIGCTVEDDEYEGSDGKKRKKSAVVAVYGVRKTTDGKWERIGVSDDEDETDVDEVDDVDLEDIEGLDEEPTENDDIELDEEEEQPKKNDKKNSSKKKKESKKEEDELDEDLDLDDLNEELEDLEEALN